MPSYQAVALSDSQGYQRKTTIEQSKQKKKNTFTTWNQLPKPTQKETWNTEHYEKKQTNKISKTKKERKMIGSIMQNFLTFYSWLGLLGWPSFLIICTHACKSKNILFLFQGPICSSSPISVGAISS
jgi:hypothetical protein